MTTPVGSRELDRAEKATPVFLRQIEAAIDEGEENVRRLRAVRSAIKVELLGEDFDGLRKAMDEAGMDRTDD